MRKTLLLTSGLHMYKHTCVNIFTCIYARECIHICTQLLPNKEDHYDNI